MEKLAKKTIAATREGDGDLRKKKKKKKKKIVDEAGIQKQNWQKQNPLFGFGEESEDE